jgi:hypothetical protein
MRKFGIVWEGKRGRPCGPIGQDGSPRWRPMPWTGTSGAALPSRPSPPTSPASHAWTRASSACPESWTARQMCCLPKNAPSRWRRGSCWTHMTSSESSSFPTASEQAQGARNPAVHVQAGLLLGQCMHRELLGTDGGADGRRGASPSEGAMAPAGRHADCCSDRRGQERPGWLTPMEHAGRFTAWQCAEIGVHLRMPPEGYLRW